MPFKCSLRGEPLSLQRQEPGLRAGGSRWERRQGLAELKERRCGAQEPSLTN